VYRRRIIGKDIESQVRPMCLRVSERSNFRSGKAQRELRRLCFAGYIAGLHQVHGDS